MCEASVKGRVGGCSRVGGDFWVQIPNASIITCAQHVASAVRTLGELAERVAQPQPERPYALPVETVKVKRRVTVTVNGRKRDVWR